MMKTLNLQQINDVSRQYQLGVCLSEPVLLDGGFLHRLYRIQTHQGEFILKQLDQQKVAGSQYVADYQQSEIISRLFVEQVPAVTALWSDQGPVCDIDGEAVMVYPCIDGSVLGQDQIDHQHRDKMAHVLSTMHQMNVQFPQPAQPYSVDKIALQYFQALSQAEYRLVANSLEKIKSVQPILQSDWVISHRDLDPKNVLWNVESQPFIIDWESVGLINRAHDIVATAIYWSFDSTFSFDSDCFTQFLQGYAQHAGEVLSPYQVEAGIYGLVGDWLIWLEFNLKQKRALNLLDSERTDIDDNIALTLSALPPLLSALKA